MQYQQFGGASCRRRHSSVKETLLYLSRFPVREGAIGRAPSGPGCSPRSITHTPLLVFAAASLFAALPAASDSVALFPVTEPQSLLTPRVTTIARASAGSGPQSAAAPAEIEPASASGDEFPTLACAGLAAPMLGSTPSLLMPLDLNASPSLNGTLASVRGSGTYKTRRAIWGGIDHGLPQAEDDERRGVRPHSGGGGIPGGTALREVE